MKKKKVFNTIYRIFGIAFLAGIAVVVLYIMGNGLGLVESLDFGAGAYYYADIPEFSKYMDATHFTSELPIWIFIVLFLLWGGIMYKFWTWIDK